MFGLPFFTAALAIMSSLNLASASPILKRADQREPINGETGGSGLDAIIPDHYLAFVYANLTFRIQNLSKINGLDAKGIAEDYYNAPYRFPTSPGAAPGPYPTGPAKGEEVDADRYSTYNAYYDLAISEGVFIQSLLLVKERFAPYKDIITKGLKESLDYLNFIAKDAKVLLPRIYRGIQQTNDFRLSQLNQALAAFG